ncbi:MAG: hypothetical protein K6E29_08585 [Cyanobacteria bacterium RUI128]|nr:hypothetical protein [Cyanobacteria bacterium RUI128]
MKKLLKGIYVLSLLVLFAATANAAGMIKDYHAYRIKGQNIRTVVPVVDGILSKEVEVKKLSRNAYYAAYGDEHYYMKFYPALHDTDVYIVTDATYDKDNNGVTEFFKSQNYQYETLKDDEAYKEYKFDFIDYARSGALDGLFTLPDGLKPLKNGMNKLNDKMSKGNEKTSTIPYSEDNDPIDLTCIDSEEFYNADADVTVTVNEYRLKNKENKYVHAFEYVIKNNSNSDIKVEKVSSERLAALKDITTSTFVDMDRLDVADTLGVPLAVATGGLSLGFTVANNVRLAKVVKEATRFSHSLPENYDLKANSSMRILCLKFKDDPQSLQFTIKKQGQDYKFEY